MLKTGWVSYLLASTQGGLRNKNNPKKQLDSLLLSVRPGALVSALVKVATTFVDRQLAEIKPLFPCHVRKPQLLGTAI